MVARVPHTHPQPPHPQTHTLPHKCLLQNIPEYIKLVLDEIVADDGWYTHRDVFHRLERELIPLRITSIQINNQTILQPKRGDPNQRWRMQWRKMDLRPVSHHHHHHHHQSKYNSLIQSLKFRYQEPVRYTCCSWSCCSYNTKHPIATHKPPIICFAV
jgi:hypothetical protein